MLNAKKIIKRVNESISINELNKWGKIDTTVYAKSNIVYITPSENENSVLPPQKRSGGVLKVVTNACSRINYLKGQIDSITQVGDTVQVAIKPSFVTLVSGNYDGDKKETMKEIGGWVKSSLRSTIYMPDVWPLQVY